MPTFFAGNILPPEEERTSQDHTFRFSKEDADNLQLVGKPIRLEHNEHLTCGKIVKQMKDRRGRVYVVGKIEDDKADAPKRAVRLFADKALGGLYNSLSLQHVHEEDMDGSNAKKTAIEVSLVNEPRRKNCNISSVRRRHAASAKSVEGTVTPSENQEYIGDVNEPSDSDAHLPSAYNKIDKMSEQSDAPAIAPAEAPADGKVGQAAAPTLPADKAAPDPNAAPAKKEGDVVMEDVIHTIVAQESELDKLKAQLAKVEEERAKLAAAEEERTKAAKEAAEKKRKADTDKATALFETVSALWDEQVTDDLWSDENSRAEQKEKMKQLIAAQPELSKDLFKIVHCASARYAEVLSGDAQRQRELTSKLGHVMKKRKTLHAASARNAPAEPATPAVSASAPAGAPAKKTLMDIMNGYGGASGTATAIMQRLYKSQMERSQNMF